MTLLEIVQKFSARSGLRKPTVVINSNDLQILQMVALLDEIVEDLSVTRIRWTAQIRELVHTSVATENQGALAILCPGFQSIIPNTVFDRTSKLRITGPFNEQEWQAAHSVPYTSAYSSFRILQGNLLLYPVPTAGHTIALEYKSNFLIQDADDSSYKAYFNKDTDQFLLQPSLIIQGLRYLWKREKGQPYAEEFASYERAVTMMEATDRVARDLSMSDSSGNCFRPGILVPDTTGLVNP